MLVLVVLIIVGFVWYFARGNDVPVQIAHTNVSGNSAVSPSPSSQNQETPVQIKNNDENAPVVSTPSVEECASAGEINFNDATGSSKKCCSGLKEIVGIPGIWAASNDCAEAQYMYGWGTICSACGNSACESWENKCNCPADCTVSSGTQNTSKNLSSSEPFSPNLEMEQNLTEIVTNVIQEQSKKGVVISIQNISVINLYGKVQGDVRLTCNKELNFTDDESIVESIAQKLFVRYPDDFAKGSKRDSWVDVHGCSVTSSSPDGVNSYSSKTTMTIAGGSVHWRI